MKRYAKALVALLIPLVWYGYNQMGVALPLSFLTGHEEALITALEGALVYAVPNAESES